MASHWHAIVGRDVSGVESVFYVLAYAKKQCADLLFLVIFCEIGGSVELLQPTLPLGPRIGFLKVEWGGKL